MVSFVGKNNAINNLYRDPSNILANDDTINLRVKLNNMDALITPVPVLINTNDTVLDSSFFGKVILFDGDNTATRFDLTLPTITNDDAGKKITFIGANGQYSGRIICDVSQHINNRPYFEIGSYYCLSLIAVVDPDESMYYSIFSSNSTLNVWDARQDTQALPYNVLTKLTLDQIVSDPDNCWDAENGQTNLAYAPGYYAVYLEVKISAISANARVSVYPYRNGVVAGDPSTLVINSLDSDTIIYEYTGYFNGLGLNPLDFRIIQTIEESSDATIVFANVSGNFISLGP